MTAFKDSIGLTAEEKVTNAITLGSNISTRNIGMPVARERGVENLPILVNTLKEDTKIFGGHDPSMYSSYTVEALFNNTGGYNANVYQARILGAGSAAATTIVKNQSANTQSLVSTTTQNSSGAQGQIEQIAVANVEVGDDFTLQFEGDDDGNGNAFDHTYTFTAVVATTASVITALKADLDTYISGGTFTGYSTSVDGDGNLIIEGPDDTVFTATTSTTNESTSEDIFEVFAGRQGKKDKGSWGNNLKTITYPINHVNGSTTGYQLNVYYKNVFVESYVSSGTNWQTLIDKVNTLSDYIMLKAIDLTKVLSLSPSENTLSGGVYVAPEKKDFEPYYEDVTGDPRGMALFEGENVQILACPEIIDLDFAQKCDAFAEKAKKFFIFNLPYLATESIAQTYYNGMFKPSQSFSASYKPWMQVSADRDGNKIWIPSLGYVLGAGYIRVAGLNNGEVWTPPASDESVAKGIFAFTDVNISDTTLSRYVKKWRTNMIKFVDGTGFILYSTRTYSTNSLFESIHIRLETNWLMASLSIRNEKAMNKLITTASANKMKVDNLLFFRNLYDRGGIEDSIPFNEAVIIDVKTSITNRKEQTLSISWIPPENLEHIHMELNRNDGILILNQ